MYILQDSELGGQMTDRRVSLSAAVLVSLAETACAAQIPRPPQPFPVENPANGVYHLARELEARYQDFIRDCGLPAPLALRKSKGAASAIDPAIIRALRLMDAPTTERPVAASLGTAFQHVWTSVEEQQLVVSWTAERNLPIDQRHLTADPVIGLPEVVESSTCGSTIGGNLSASADSPFPIGTLAAALRLETQRDRQARMIVMDGEFVNPLWQMWIGQNVDASLQRSDKINAALIFWDWRARPNQNQGDARLLTQFTGTHIFRSLRESEQLSADARAEARISYLVANVDSAVSAVTTQQSELRLSDYRLLIGKEGATRQAIFRDLPSASAIAAEVAKADLQVEFPHGSQVLLAQPRVFDLLFPRLPAAFCSAGAWEIRGTGGNSFTLDEQPVSDTAAKACRFKIRFTPATATSPVDTLAPVLTSRTALTAAGPAPQEIRLQIPLTRLSFTRLPVPELQYQSAATISTTPIAGSPPRANVTIRHTFLAQRMKDYGNAMVNAENVIMTCPDGYGGAHPDWAQSRLTGTGANRVFELIGNSIYHGALQPDAEPQMCSLSGSITVRHATNGEDVTVPIERIEVAYPRPSAPIVAQVTVRARSMQ